MKKLINAAQMGILLPQIKKILKIKPIFPDYPTLDDKIELPWKDVENHRGFVCCDTNQIGLKVELYKTKNADIACKWTSKKGYENYPGMLHGGISFAILDEMMGQNAFYETGSFAVSLNTNTQWLKAIKVNEEIVGTSRVVKKLDNFLLIESFLFRKDQKLAAKAKGLYFLPSLKQFSKIAEVETVPKEFQAFFKG